MPRKAPEPNRIHLIGHGNPIGPDATRFGLEDVPTYVEFAERHLPAPLRLTYDMDLLTVVEEPWEAGRHDDAERIKDINAALRDRRTLAIVAAAGGAYFSRILPHLDFSPLTRRQSPLWMLGFSEMSTIVNLVASYRWGRGLYWLGPNWLSSRLRPAEAARAALGEFWRLLPEVLSGRRPTDAYHLSFEPVQGELVAGRLKSGSIRVVGGCLAVLAATVGSPLARRYRPMRKWLMLEDLKESPYRIDRHLAALKLAGWLEAAAGLIIGDFHMLNNDTQPAVLKLLEFHLPRKRKVPIVTTRSVGHVWPMSPMLLNRPAEVSVSGSDVVIDATGLR